MLTPEQIRADEIFGAKVNMVVESLAGTYGPIEINVVFQGIANWVGMLIFRTNGSPLARREVIRRFFEQVELIITKQEQGKGSGH